MKKNLLNELNQMKYLFGYEKGRVISEQKKRLKEDDFEEDIIFADPDVMEPEVKPDTDRDVEEKPYRPGRPDRDPSRLPYTDPDTHPQGRRSHYDKESDPYAGDDFGYESNGDLEDLVMKYLRSKR